MEDQDLDRLLSLGMLLRLGLLGALLQVGLYIACAVVDLGRGGDAMSRWMPGLGETGAWERGYAVEAGSEPVIYLGMGVVLAAALSWGVRAVLRKAGAGRLELGVLTGTLLPWLLPVAPLLMASPEGTGWGFAPLWTVLLLMGLDVVRRR